jgi:hypothetical protein
MNSMLSSRFLWRSKAAGELLVGPAQKIQTACVGSCSHCPAAIGVRSARASMTTVESKWEEP